MRVVRWRSLLPPIVRSGGQTELVVTDERAVEYDQIRRSLIAWASDQEDIQGIAVVGSWARAAAGMDSDIDVVVLTVAKDQYLNGDDWVEESLAQPAGVVRTREWGPLTERRVLLASGLEVEFGFVGPDWAATDPVDPGTAGVVLDGCDPLLDPHGLLKGLIAAVRGAY
jgi:predicted nucleotidyltransferase